MLTTARDGLRRRSIPRTGDWGIALAVVAALISGLAVYLNAFAVKQLPDAAVYTTLKNAVAAGLLVALTIALGGIREARAIERRRWPAILLVGVVGGSVPFVLFFAGLAQASAPTAAFIQKTLFIWVAFLAVPALGETLGIATLAGLGLLLVGQALVLPPTGIVWGAGETMILVATLLWALETVLVRRLLDGVSSHLMAALRMGVGVVILIGYLAVSGRLASILTLTSTQWSWTLLTGLILAGYVATWFAALRRAPATVVTSVLVLGAVVTGALTAVSKGAPPSPTVVAGYLLIVAASALIVAWTRVAARRLASAGAAGNAAGVRA
jgi:drug/metabolite transporter (DMT)-like permease